MVNKLIPIRMPPHQELMGADLAEHLIRHTNVGVSRALSQLQPFHPDTGGIHLIQNIGSNPGTIFKLKHFYNLSVKLYFS